MSLVLDLPADLEAALTREAEAWHLPLPQYAVALLRKAVAPAGEKDLPLPADLGPFEVVEDNLTWHGTRLLLAHIMEFVAHGYDWALIQSNFAFTDEETREVKRFIDDNAAFAFAVHREAEMLAHADRTYWEEHNRDLFTRIETKNKANPSPQYVKFLEHKAKLESKRAVS